MQKRLSIVLFIFLLSGIAAGYMLSTKIGGGSVSAYIEKLNFAPSPGQAFFSIYFLPLIIFLLGFTAFGAPLIPPLFGGKVLFVSFAVSSLIAHQGLSGIFLITLSFAIQTLLTLPCLFILSLQGMGSSLSVARVLLGKGKSSRGFYGRQALLRTALCVVILASAGFIEAYALPFLFNKISI